MNREDFPMLKKDFVYFNNAATTYKPQIMINALVDFYQNYSFNTNRGVDSSSYQVTQKYENVRQQIANMLKTSSEKIVFTRGTTDGINMVARMVENKLTLNDEILVNYEEHHAVYLTMKQLSIRANCQFKVVDYEKITETINEKTKIVAISQKTNVFGRKGDLEKLAALKKRYQFTLIVDGAQGIVSDNIDVDALNIDFYAFSAHKMFGPFGLGVLYIKDANHYQPVVFGGEMVDQVSENTFKKAPFKFEAGTMMIPAVIAFGETLKYLASIDLQKRNDHVLKLRQFLVQAMKKDPEIIIYNENEIDSGIITFNIKNMHAHDMATIFDKNKIIVRAGHHCAEPLMIKLNVSATIRVSLAFYNNLNECQKFLDVLNKRKEYYHDIF